MGEAKGPWGGLCVLSWRDYHGKVDQWIDWGDHALYIDMLLFPQNMNSSQYHVSRSPLFNHSPYYIDTLECCTGVATTDNRPTHLTKWGSNTEILRYCSFPYLENAQCIPYRSAAERRKDTVRQRSQHHLPSVLPISSPPMTERGSINDSMAAEAEHPHHHPAVPSSSHPSSPFSARALPWPWPAWRPSPPSSGAHVASLPSPCGSRKCVSQAIVTSI